MYAAMYSITLPFSRTAIAWRRIARRLLSARIAPEFVEWAVGATEMVPTLPDERYKARVPERFVILTETAVWHSDPSRFDLLYRLAWRLRLQPSLVGDRCDPDVLRLLEMENDVLRAHRKLGRDLRLHEVGRQAGRRIFAGWCDVPHDPLELALPKYQRQFSEFDWVIYTPQRMVRCTQGNVSLAQAPERPELLRDTMHSDWYEWLRAQVCPTPSKDRTDFSVDITY